MTNQLYRAWIAAVEFDEANRVRRIEFERGNLPKPKPREGSVEPADRRIGLKRMHDLELALVAAALHICIDRWIADEDSGQTAAERTLQSAYDAVYAEGEARHKRGRFGNERDFMEKKIREMTFLP